MNPFLLPPDARLAHWKEFRKSLAELDEQAQLEAVAQYWSKTPLLTIAYNPDDATTWDSAWEMIHDGNWCRSSIAIGMEATLRLAGWAPERLLLRHIIDRDISEQIMILRIDAQWALNYDWGHLVPYPQTTQQILRQFRFNGRCYMDAGVR